MLRKFLVIGLLLAGLNLLAEVPLPPPPPEETFTIPGETTTETQAQENFNQTSIYRLIRNFMRTLRTNFRFNFNPPPTDAGDAIKDLRLVGDFSYGHFDDGDLGGNGHDLTESGYVTGRVADLIDLTLGVSNGYYEVDGDSSLEQTTNTLDLFGSYNITDQAAVGLFMQYGKFRIRPDRTEGDAFDRYAAGVTGSYRIPTDIAEFGISATLASFNRQSMTKFFYCENSAVLTTVDAQKMLTDNLGVDLYTTLFTMLERTGADPNYFIIGADATYQINEKWMVSLGYETIAGYDRYDEQRINATVVYTW